MRILLQVLNGRYEGHQIALSSGQTIEVGRSALCDWCFDHDQMMSRTHFSLSVEDHGCRLQDLNSSYGTFVNQHKVQDVYLSDCDEILVGQTTLGIRIEGAANNFDRGSGKDQSASNPTHQPIPMTSAPSFEVQCQKSGVIRFFGGIENHNPIKVANILWSRFQPIAIVEGAIFAEIQSSAAIKGAPLFDWLEEDKNYQSPQVVTCLESLKRLPFFDRLWGQNAMTLVFTPQGEALPLEHLRRSAAAFARPSLLWPQVTETDSTYASALLDELSAVLIEGPSENEWSVLSNENLSPILVESGMTATRQTLPVEATAQVA